MGDAAAATRIQAPPSKMGYLPPPSAVTPQLPLKAVYRGHRVRSMLLELRKDYMAHVAEAWGSLMRASFSLTPKRAGGRPQFLAELGLQRAVPTSTGLRLSCSSADTN